MDSSSDTKNPVVGDLATPDDIVGEVVITDKVTRQIVDDILCAAFEGGINYWHHNKVEVKYGDYKGGTYASDVISRSGVVILRPNEEDLSDDEPREYELTLDKFIFGLSKACDHFKCNLTGLYDDHDASSADVVVQYAIFGKEVFG